MTIALRHFKKPVVPNLGLYKQSEDKSWQDYLEFAIRIFNLLTIFKLVFWGYSTEDIFKNKRHSY